MVTRPASLSPLHVEALSAISIEFYGNRKKFRDVIEAWKRYLDYLSQDQVAPDVWAQKRGMEAHLKAAEAFMLIREVNR